MVLSITLFLNGLVPAPRDGDRTWWIGIGGTVLRVGNDDIDFYAEKAIESHNQWIKEHPEDTVHLGELDDWYNARNRCASWIRKNCSTRRDCKGSQSRGARPTYFRAVGMKR